MTVLLRIILLPLSIFNEMGKTKALKLRREVEQIQKDYKNDPVARKIAIRRYLKGKQVNPWAKAVLLGVQGLVLLLLYQVFVGGIYSAEKIHLIYPSIIKPDFINTNFLWFDIARPSLIFSALVAGYLFIESMLLSWINKEKLNRKEQIFMIFFPAFVFLILALLPSAKSIFVLTSLIFSSIITAIVMVIRINIVNNKKKTN